jgi:hypothetical protein
MGLPVISSLARLPTPTQEDILISSRKAAAHEAAAAHAVASQSLSGSSAAVVATASPRSTRSAVLTQRGMSSEVDSCHQQQQVENGVVAVGVGGRSCGSSSRSRSCNRVGCRSSSRSSSGSNCWQRPSQVPVLDLQKLLLPVGGGGGGGPKAWSYVGAATGTGTAAAAAGTAAEAAGTATGAAAAAGTAAAAAGGGAGGASGAGVAGMVGMNAGVGCDEGGHTTISSSSSNGGGGGGCTMGSGCGFSTLDCADHSNCHCVTAATSAMAVAALAPSAVATSSAAVAGVARAVISPPTTAPAATAAVGNAFAVEAGVSCLRSVSARGSNVGVSRAKSHLGRTLTRSAQGGITSTADKEVYLLSDDELGTAAQELLWVSLHTCSRVTTPNAMGDGGDSRMGTRSLQGSRQSTARVLSPRRAFDVLSSSSLQHNQWVRSSKSSTAGGGVCTRGTGVTARSKSSCSRGNYTGDTSTHGSAAHSPKAVGEEGGGAEGERSGAADSAASAAAAHAAAVAASAAGLNEGEQKTLEALLTGRRRSGESCSSHAARAGCSCCCRHCSTCCCKGGSVG